MVVPIDLVDVTVSSTRLVLYGRLVVPSNTSLKLVQPRPIVFVNHAKFATPQVSDLLLAVSRVILSAQQSLPAQLMSTFLFLPRPLQIKSAQFAPRAHHPHMLLVGV
jgi:hypothetical protein